MEPARTGGLQVVDRSLAKLSTHRRLLVVGAHPDDEDTSLLSLVGRGLGGEAGYLSLSRGEGGQNLIGPELGLGLGLIRTGELLSARQVEGTRQFFTRAYDFGYTRSLEETFGRWSRRSLLEDAVRAIRRFKPQVVVAVFPGDERAGHGQHQAAGVIAEEAFRAAGLPDRFPGLTASGFPPWEPEVLYQRVWWGREPADVEFDLGILDPLTGRSMAQLAAASRSMHRSQDMGSLQSLGRRVGGLIRVEGQIDTDSEGVFGGVDTSLAAIANLATTESLRERIRAELERISDLAGATRIQLSPSSLDAAVPALAEIVSRLATLEEECGRLQNDAAVAPLRDLVAEKRAVAAIALTAASGVAIDAVADRELIVLGDSFAVTFTVWNSGSRRVEVLDADLHLQPGWQASDPERIEVDAAEGLQQWVRQVTVSEPAGPTVPYFLRRPLQGDFYDWQGVDEADRGEPLGTPPAVALFDLEIEGVRVRIAREVVYQYRSQAEGELRRPLRSVPPVEVTLQPELILWPDHRVESREVEVLVRSHRPGSTRGTVVLRSSHRWPERQELPFSIEEAGDSQTVRFILEPPDPGFVGRVELEAETRLAEGGSYSTAFPVIDYPHVRPVPMPLPARLEIQTLDLELPGVERVGYIRGASDRVPEVLVEIGLPVEILASDALQTANLNDFDAIVVGSRAYESDPWLAAVNGRLLDYVRAGGLLLVQYQQYQFADGEFAPIRLEIARPHGRVTDEAAPVRVLDTDHPIFHTPNRITDADWQYWVQERGLYFAAGWEKGFTPLLEIHDEAQPPEEGALLVAKVGRGTYIYTGLSFFRQLPAGVPGAIRLFVNLLARERR